MFKGAKGIAVVLIMIVVFAALALSGCMPAGGTGTSAEGGGAETSSGLMTFLPLVLIIVVFYFILIRPQNKKNKQVNEMRSSIKRGDYITTIGGFKGRVVRVKDDDTVTIEVGSDKTKLEIMRWGISKIDESAPERKSGRESRKEELKEEEEEEKPKRMPKKLTAAPKKEEEPEDEEPEDADYEDEDDDEDDDE